MRRRYGAACEGADCSPAMLAEASRRYPRERFTRADVRALPYENGAFDAVTTVFTLRNFPDLDGALREMARARGSEHACPRRS